MAYKFQIGSAILSGALSPTDDSAFDLGASGKEWKDLYVDGTAYVDAINYNGTAITANAAELNKLASCTVTTAELNKLNGSTSNSAANKLIILDGAVLNNIAIYLRGTGVHENIISNDIIPWLVRRVLLQIQQIRKAALPWIFFIWHRCKSPPHNTLRFFQPWSLCECPACPTRIKSHGSIICINEKVAFHRKVSVSTK